MNALTSADVEFAQLFRLVFGAQGLDHLVQVALEDVIQPVKGQVDTVIRHAVLGKIVRANPLAAIPRTDERFPLFSSFGVLLLLFPLVQSCFQYTEGLSQVIVTTSPVGRCVMRTAESVVLTLWPPGPLA